MVMGGMPPTKILDDLDEESRGIARLGSIYSSRWRKKVSSAVFSTIAAPIDSRNIYLRSCHPASAP